MKVGLVGISSIIYKKQDAEIVVAETWEDSLKT